MKPTSSRPVWSVPGWLLALVALVLLLCLVVFYVLFWPRHPGALRGGPAPQTQQKTGQLSPPSRLGSNSPPQQTRSAEAANQPILPAPPVEITVPADTIIAVRTRAVIDSDTNVIGSRFPGAVISPVAIDGQIAIPAGSAVVLRLAEKKKTGFFHRSLQIKLALGGISVDGRIYPFQADPVSLKAGKNNNAGDGNENENPAPKGQKALVVLPNTDLTFTLTAPLTIQRAANSDGK